MNDQGNKYSKLMQKMLPMIAVSIVYYLCAKLSMNLAFVGTNVCPIWLPSGIAISGFLFLGESLWIGILASVFILEFQFFTHLGFDLNKAIIASSFIAIGNVLEALLASYLIKRFIKIEKFFEQSKSILAFLLISSLSCIVSTFVGLSVLNFSHLTDIQSHYQLWISWWLANLGGIFIIVPCVIAFHLRSNKFVDNSRTAESIIFFIVLFLVDYLSFDIHSPIAKANLPIAYPILLLIIWCGYRLGTKRTCAAIVLIFAQVVIGTYDGGGPFSSSHLNFYESLISVQIFTIVISMVGLFFLAMTAEKQKAIKELRDFQRFFMALVENSSEMKLLINNEGVINFSSHSVEKILGYKREEFNGLRLIDFVHPEDRDKVARNFSQIFSLPGFMLTDFARVKHKNGSWRWIEGSGKNMLQDPAIKAMVINCKDITEQRVIEHILKSSEERLRQIIDLVPHFIFAKDLNGRFILVNKAVAQAYGTTVEDLIGKTDANFNKSQEEVDHFIKDDLEVIRSGKPKIIPEELITDSEGNQRYLSTTKIPFNASGIDQKCVLGVSVDITELKKAEEVLKKDLKQAARLADVGTLAAIVAHELRTPLGVIQMAAHNLKMKNKSLIEDKHLQNIQMKVWEGNRIIDNLLSYSKIKAPTYGFCKILDLLDECVGNIIPQYVEKIIHVNKDYQIDQDLMISIDPDQMRVVFTNLLSNACQAIESKEGQITIKAQKNGLNHLKVVIRDNGVGISAADLERIFLPFFTTKIKGTGLGLTICNEVINLHKGTLDIQSEKNKGTEVSILIPISPAVNSRIK